MFSLVTGLYDSYLAPTQLNLLVVGAPGVGKTTLLERLKVTQIPKRPANKSSLLTAEEELVPVLKEAFLKGGAVVDGNNVLLQDHDNNNKNNNKVGKSSSSSPVKMKFPQKIKPSPSPVVVMTPKRRNLLNIICPAPERYRKAAEDDDEEFVLDEQQSDDTEDFPPESNNDNNKNNKDDQNYIPDGPSEPTEDHFSVPLEAPASPVAPMRVRCHSKEMTVDQFDLSDDRGDGSLEDIPIDGGGGGGSGGTHDNSNNTPKHDAKNNNTPRARTKNDGSASSSDQNGKTPAMTMPLQQSTFQEYDLKPDKKMLPMNKIRPTIGTNLGKLDMYGAKCNIFDVGGRLRDLWERYYEDCDAVIFCWRLGDDPDKANNNNNKNDDDSESDDEEPFDMLQQQEILNQVRQAISDDVPFLIFGHIFGNANLGLVDKHYSTNLLLPHYHNPITGLMCGSAKTGAGVVPAMEWLIPLAKRQQKERISAASQKSIEEGNQG